MGQGQRLIAVLGKAELAVCSRLTSITVQDSRDKSPQKGARQPDSETDEFHIEKKNLVQ